MPKRGQGKRTKFTTKHVTYNEDIINEVSLQNASKRPKDPREPPVTRLNYFKDSIFWMEEKEEEDEEPLIVSTIDNLFKSKTDLKQYRLVTLKSGLEVLLISTLELAISRDADLTTQKAAAAMLVQVGSFADPKEAEGIAHFLEVCYFFKLNTIFPK